MKEIKRTRTVEEVTGYEAFDGKMFKTKEECENYEGTAYAVLRKRLNSLAVSVDGGIHSTFAECEMFEKYGYGSEEYEYMIVDIKNADDLMTVNQYYEYMKKSYNVKPENLKNDIISDKYIGKRVLINIGYNYDLAYEPDPRTMDELIDQFRKDMNSFFYPEEKGKENDKEN